MLGRIYVPATKKMRTKKDKKKRQTRPDQTGFVPFLSSVLVKTIYHINCSGGFNKRHDTQRNFLIRVIIAVSCACTLAVVEGG